jgi:hypothetical protein
MDGDDCRLMLSIFDDELSGSAVIGFGSAPALKGFYGRTFHLNPANAETPVREPGDVQWLASSLQAAE